MSLDIQFYRDFYGLAGKSDIQINEHYFSKGKQLNALIDWSSYYSCMADLLSLDPELYQSLNMDKSQQTIREASSEAMSLQQIFDGFYSDALVPSQYNASILVKAGALYSLPSRRMLNELDMVLFSERIKAFQTSLMQHFEFDEDFYMTFYTIPSSITTKAELFWYWLTVGVFKGELPSQKWMQTKSLMFEFLSILPGLGVDLSYIANNCSMLMIGRCSKAKIAIPHTLQHVDRTMCLFFNTMRDWRFFWNGQEQDDYIAKCKGDLDARIAQLKAPGADSVALVAQAKVQFAKELDAAKLGIVRERVVQLKRHSMESLASQMPKLLKKYSSAEFLAMYRRCNKMLDSIEDLDVVKEIIVKIMANMQVASVDEHNSLTIKSFIVSFIHNAFLGKRDKSVVDMPSDSSASASSASSASSAVTKLSKAAYSDFVKETGAVVVKDIFSKLGTSFQEENIMKDIEFIIANKKVIKLASVGALLAANVFW